MQHFCFIEDANSLSMRFDKNLKALQINHSNLKESFDKDQEIISNLKEDVRILKIDKEI